MKTRAKLWLFGLTLGLLVPGASAFAQTIVSLTFDDGVGDAPAAQAILDAHGMKGTFYIISGSVNDTPDYMTLAQLLALQTDGHEIGGHTITHPNLTTLTAAQQQHEICDGRTALIGMGLSPVVSFAYPEGAANSTTETIAKSCYTSGRGAWCNNPGANGSCTQSIPPAEPYWIETPEAVVNTTTLAQLEGYVTAAENSGGGWVPIQFHHICNNCDQYSISSANLTSFLNWLQPRAGSGTVVETVAQVMGGAPVIPWPAIASFSPPSSTVSGPAFTLTVNGFNFVSGSTVQWNGSSRTTTFVNSTKLTALIPASDLTTVSIATVTVSNPGGAISSGMTFTVGNPVPVLTTISPSSTTVSSPAFTLTVKGSNFISSSIVQWNGSARTTTLVNNTTLTALIPASDLSTVKIASVTVFNAAPGGGTSSIQTFTIGNPVPVLTSISPSSTTVSSPAFTLNVKGSNFVASSVLQWNGSARTTTFVNSTTLTAQIPASDLASVGIVNATVSNPAPGGGTSSGQTFTVGNPAPALTTLSPSFAVIGSTGVTLTVTGSNFVSGAVVRWNGSARSTSFVNSTTLSAQIPATDLTFVGTDAVTIFNSTPGGGTTSAQTFTVGYPAPVLITLSPSSTIVGSPAFTLTATGSNFVASSVIQWNGSAITTTFVNSTTLTALIPASDLSSVGTSTLTVSNPAPAGGTSSGQIFSVVNPIPVVTALSSTYTISGNPAFTLTIDGSNFVNSSVVQWVGHSNLIPTSVTATSIHVTVPDSYISEAGNTTISVFNPAPGGGPSGGQSFVINPVLSSIASFTLTAARVHPNPWRANLHAGQVVTFDELPADSTVKIFTSSAHWIRTLSAPAGSATWDLKNDSGDNVASGYYIYLVTNPQGKSRGIVANIR